MNMKVVFCALVIFSTQLVLNTKSSAHVEFIHDNQSLVERAEFKKRMVFLLSGVAVTFLAVQAISGVSKRIEEKFVWKKLLKRVKKDQKKLDENIAQFTKKNTISLVFDEESQETRLVRDGKMLEPSVGCGKDLEPTEAYWKNLSKNNDIFGFINEKGGATIVKDKGDNRQRPLSTK